LSRDSVERALASAARDGGLGNREAASTIRSGLEAGLLAPRVPRGLQRRVRGGMGIYRERGPGRARRQVADQEGTPYSARVDVPEVRLSSTATVAASLALLRRCPCNGVAT